MNKISSIKKWTDSTTGIIIITIIPAITSYLGILKPETVEQIKSKITMEAIIISLLVGAVSYLIARVYSLSNKLKLVVRYVDLSIEEEYKLKHLEEHSKTDMQMREFETNKELIEYILKEKKQIYEFIMKQKMED